jgi:prepilin-type N-terminal cleavage/methylation domain-containing protein
MSKKTSWHAYAYAILKVMKGGKKARGFTIVETLVVLAVTGVLFSAIVVTLSGRQAKTQFTQAVQEIQSQIQQVISDVATGYYPSAHNFNCTATLAGPQFTAGTTEQGGNEGCIFLGKAIQLGVPSTKNTIEDFKIYSIAGLQRTTTKEEVQTYTQALPKVVSSGAIDTTETKSLLYGLTTKEAYYGASNTQVATIAFVNSLASYSGGSIVSGSQQVRVMPVRNSTLGMTQAQAITNINSQLATSDIDPSTGVRICFVSGGTNQSGLITIGSNGRQLSVTLNMKSNKTCA